MGASPPATEAEGLAAPLLINQRNRISIDERWPDDEEAPVQQQQYNKATCLTHPYSQQQQQSQLQPENDGGTLRALVFGGINTLVGLPALIAFATIVFQVGGLKMAEVMYGLTFKCISDILFELI